MLQIKNLEKKFGKVLVLKDINLNLAENQFYVFYGKNGSGKSTLLKVLSKIIFKTKGEILLDKKVSYLPDKYIMPKRMKVRSYVKEIFKLYHIKENERDVIKAYHIPDKKIGDLSKGNLQKLGILQIIKNDANYYIFDEPLDGLDDNAKRLFKEEIILLLKKEKTVIMSLHNRSYFSDLNPKVFEIKNGECYEKKKK